MHRFQLWFVMRLNDRVCGRWGRMLGDLRVRTKLNSPAQRRNRHPKVLLIPDWVFLSLFYTYCCPRTAGFLEMRLEKWILLAFMDGFDPDNEDQFAMGSRLLHCMPS